MNLKLGILKINPKNSVFLVLIELAKKMEDCLRDDGAPLHQVKNGKSTGKLSFILKTLSVAKRFLLLFNQ